MFPIGRKILSSRSLWGRKTIFDISEPKPVQVTPVLVVLDRDGNPLDAYPVGLQLPGGDSRQVNTDANGEYQLPTMDEGEQFTVTDGGTTGQSETFVAEAGKEKYYFKLDYVRPAAVSPVLVVLDRDGNPLGAYPVGLQLPGGDNLSIETDGRGEYHLPEMHEGDQFTVTDGGSTGRSETFTVESGKDKYYFKLDYSKPGPPPPPVPVTPMLIVIDRDDKPVASFPIDLQLPDGQSSHVFTGEKGEYVLPTMLVGDQFTVSDSFSGHSETFVVEAGKDTYYFKLNYVPTEQKSDITIKVVDEDEKPTRLYAVMGRLDKVLPEIRVRASCGGKFIPVDPADVFDTKSTSFPHPSVWDEKIELPEPTNVLALHAPKPKRRFWRMGAKL